MPSKSQAQHNLMAMVANDPKAAKRVGISQSVGADYMHADKGKSFGKGAVKSRPDLQKLNKPSSRHGKTALFSEGGTMAKTKLPPFMGKETPSEEKKEMKVKKLSPKLYREGEKREGVHGKSGMEKPSKYAAGGAVEPKKAPPKKPKDTMPPETEDDTPSWLVKKAKGGSINGIASRGKTKGKTVAMKKGGRCM